MREKVDAILASPEMLALLEQVQKSAPAMTHTMARLEQLHKTGALDTLLDTAEVIHAARKSMGDGMIHRMGGMARTAAEMGDTLLTSGLPEELPGLVQAVADARADAARDTGTIGVLGLLKALKDPKVQFTLKFLLGLARRTAPEQ